MARKHLALGFIASILFAHLLLTAFRRGWTHMDTDFPNYYSAARLTLERQPLRDFYDWTWFQRQINFAGIEERLGAYTPHTPLTMLPLLPMAALDAQSAKRIWIVLELVFLAASVYMLARLTGFHFIEVAVVALLARSALSANLALGQYYLFVLFLLTASVACIARGRPFAGGFLLGLIFAVKLYTAPFVLFFAVRKQWRALAGMIAAIASAAIAAIAIFGFDAVWFFATTVMPRALDGTINDPHHPGWGSFTAFLRRTFVREAELNPNPLFDVPALFFILRAAYLFGLLALALLVIKRSTWDGAKTLGWFAIVLFALSPLTAPYHFILLLVPVILFLRGAAFRWSAGLIVLYVLAALPLRPWYDWLFPKAWILLAMIAYTAGPKPFAMPRKVAAAVLGIVLVLSAADGWRRWRSYREEAPRHAAPVAVRPGHLFSSAAAIGEGGIYYQALASEGRYVLRSGGGETFAFSGHAFHPAAAPGGPFVYFELVSRRTSSIQKFDPTSGRLEEIIGAGYAPMQPAISLDGTKLAFVSRGSLYVRQQGSISKIAESTAISVPAFFPDGKRIAYAEGVTGQRPIRVIDLQSGVRQVLISGGDHSDPAVSPDGTMLAFVESETGARNIWVQDVKSGTRFRITSGACNNDTPVWRPDSRSIVFASDCGRGLGLPALYEIAARR